MKILLFSLVIFLSLNVCLISVHAQQGNFILIYNFDEGKGDTIKDLSGRGNDGKLTDPLWVPDGKFGGGIEFNGNSSLIEVPHRDSLNPGGDKLTIMAWLKPISLPGGHPPIARKGSVTEGCWGLDTPGGKLRGFAYLAGGGALIAEGATVMKLKEWNHTAMVYDGKEIRVYLDGKLDGSVKASGKINEKAGVSVWISKKADEAVFLNSVMDELAILNIGLSEAEIKNYMERGIKVAVERSGKMATLWGNIRGL